eukprot:TRINITY_DN14294_c0_g3_i1.p1 TRINITY_DN14294_c0_g3~~TRINITY_DN14294_c0_g3_i1.p1  ORF type:complete len:345 (+),score=47.87 TRINITY_DN14294_c0_g3_i1:147-1181(+)
MSSKVANQRVQGQPNYTRVVSAHGNGEHQVRMLVVALDYKKTQSPLTATLDAKNIEDYAHACGVTDITALYNEQCTRDNVLSALKATTANCGKDDYFVFYYAGHGTNVKDTTGEEADGQNEAFVLVDQQGGVSLDTVLVDDDFSAALLQDCGPDVRVVIIADCCHSGTIADLDRPRWRGRQAISLSGCRDSQTSGDTGRGGIFTHSLLLAAAKLSCVGLTDYAVGALYNAALKESEEVFHAQQHIEIQTTPGMTPDQMAWPLLPARGYEAPLQAALRAQASGQQFGGVLPSTLQYVKQEMINAPVSVEEYISHAVAAGVRSGPIRDCAGRASRVCAGPDSCALQ